MTRAWWRYYLAGGAAIVAAYYALPPGLARDICYLTIGLSCVGAICLGLRWHQPDRRNAWYLMAVGQLVWTIGDAIDSWNVDVTHTDAFPSAADGFYLAAYPILGAAIVLLIRRRQTGRDAGGLLDRAIVTCGLGGAVVGAAGPAERLRRA